MHIEYNFKKNPSNLKLDSKSKYHPVVVSKGTISTKELFKAIASSTTYSESELKGVLEAIKERLTTYLSNGYNVELEDIGVFSLSLKSDVEIQKKNINAQSIKIDKVNIRPAASLNKNIRGKFKRSSSEINQSKESTLEKRQQLLETHLSKNSYITRTDYGNLTSLLKGKAIKDLNTFVAEGILTTQGSGSHKIWVKKV